MRKYNPNIHNRRSIRLKGYDYSQAGLYFVTIVTQNRKCLFGEIVVGTSLVDVQNVDVQNVDVQNVDAQNVDVQNVNDQNVDDQNVDDQNVDVQNANAKMILNNAGKMIENEWLKLPQRFKNIKLHEYTIMPNHFHAILEITVGEKKGQPQGIAPTGKTVGDMIGAFESITTVEYIRGVKTKQWVRFDGKLWHRNYWEHIIRNENEYNRIAQYIIDNPTKWKNDNLNNRNIVMEASDEYNTEIWMI